MLVTGLIVAYGYMIEAFIAWYSGNVYEGFVIVQPHDRPVRAGLLGADPLQRRHPAGCCGSSASARTSPALFVISLIVNVGMWLERFVIIVTSLHRDFLPSSWGMFTPTFWDWSHVRRHDRPVPGAAVPVPALPADDFDLRDAHAPAGSQGRDEDDDEPLMPSPHVYGLMAEFDDPNALVAATHRARTRGYRRMDAYSPFRSKSCTRRSARTTRSCRSSCSSAAWSAASAATRCSTGRRRSRIR